MKTDDGVQSVSTNWPVTKDRRFIYDGWNMIAEIDASLTDGSLALFRSYAWGKDLSGTPQGAGGVGGLLMIQERDLRRRHLAIQTTLPAVYAPCTDLNGNILAYIEINRGEGLTHSFEYDAFGKELAADTLVPSSNGTAKETLPFRFSTKYHDDETGLAYYGYRYYNTDMGRWLNRDPIAEQGGINLYGMVGNDAVNKWDYLGMTGCCPRDKFLKDSDDLRKQADSVVRYTFGESCITTADMTFGALKIPACWMCRVECRRKFNLKSDANILQWLANIIVNPTTGWGRAQGLNHCVVMCMAQDDEGYMEELMLDNWEYPSHRGDSPDAFRQKFPFLEDQDFEPYASTPWTSGNE